VGKKHSSYSYRLLQTVKRMTPRHCFLMQIRKGFGRDLVFKLVLTCTGTVLQLLSFDFSPLMTSRVPVPKRDSFVLFFGSV
jgi:hypothetical protein